MALTPYTLEQAETDLGDLRGQVDRLQEFLSDGTGSGVFLQTGTFAAVDPVNDGAETWHSLGSPGLANITSDHGRYRMTPEGEVEFDIVLHATANAASQATTYANTLPVAYRPAVQRAYPLGTNQTQLTTDRMPRVVITTAGAVNIGLPAITSGNVVGAVFCMPLD